jgi:Uma2 family endonuclease
MLLVMKSSLYTVDPSAPRAPSHELWATLSPDERRRIVNSLPRELPVGAMAPPEGTEHYRTKARALDTLERFFKRTGRKVFLASELIVYYPGADPVVPDLMAVIDAEPGERTRWVVEDEGRGLDFVMEVHCGGGRKAAAEEKVKTYAKLRIPEYFIYDRERIALSGYRLASTNSSSYKRIVGQGGRYTSEVLKLDLTIEKTQLRFLFGDAPLPEADELIERITLLSRQLEDRADEEARLRAEEARLRAEEARLRAEEARLRAEEARLRAEEAKRRAEAERRVAELENELRKLKGKSPKK